MKILTIGNGFVADHLPYENVSWGSINLGHIRKIEHCELILAKYQPDVVINCLGKTGRPNVDWCESNKEETAFANVAVPIMLAEACAKSSVHMIQIGSGCIYFGQSPYMGHTSYAKDTGWREDNFANPLSFYSKTKYACDLMLGPMPQVTTLRIRMPVSDKDTPRNLINKLRGYKKVIDIPNSMTLMSDLVNCIDWAAHKQPGGIFHVVNPRPITAARIMREYQKYIPKHQFEIITERELDDMTIAKRSNCILNTDKLQRAGFKMTDSEEALGNCMANYVNNMRRNNV